MVNHQFVAKAVKPLVDMLLPQLLKQEEGQDLDEATWNLDMAAGTCLGFLANVVGDEVVGHVMPFVQVRWVRMVACSSLLTHNGSPA